jgi:hypothetical protein
MDLFQALGSDAGLLLFLAAGLVTTTVAILHDTRSHATHLAKVNARVPR